MTVHFETYQNLLMEIYYREDGKCCACCSDPVEEGIYTSQYFDTPKEAFEDLKKILDRAYFELK